MQLCSLRCWNLDSNYCRSRCRKSQPRFVLSPLLLHLRRLGTFQSNIPLFTSTWPAKHNPNHRWEVTLMLYLYPMGGIYKNVRFVPCLCWFLYTDNLSPQTRDRFSFGKLHFTPKQLISYKKNLEMYKSPHRPHLPRVLQPIRSPENPGTTVVSIGHWTPWPENPGYRTQVLDNISIHWHIMGCFQIWWHVTLSP